MHSTELDIPGANCIAACGPSSFLTSVVYYGRQRISCLSQGVLTATGIKVSAVCRKDGRQGGRTEVVSVFRSYRTAVVVILKPFGGQTTRRTIDGTRIVRATSMHVP